MYRSYTVHVIAICHGDEVCYFIVSIISHWLTPYGYDSLFLKMVGGYLFSLISSHDLLLRLTRYITSQHNSAKNFLN
jgi:hypothetical protein